MDYGVMIYNHFAMELKLIPATHKFLYVQCDHFSPEGKI